jgi:competence protein ComEA
MDRIAEWRPVEPAGPDGPAGSDAYEASSEPGSQAPGPSSNRRLIGAAAVVLSVAICAIAGAVAFVVLAGSPRPAVAIDSSSSPAAASGPPASVGPGTSGIANVVVDVEGAVNQSGLFRLALGSRVGDAITAAGGYSAQVDIEAATAALNLAAVLTDGQQIHVPLRGEATSLPVPVAGGTAGPSTGGALLDINTATAEELDTLPGIGPVTAAKIIAARQETPFATVDALAERSVVGASTLEKIRSLITVTP